MNYAEQWIPRLARKVAHEAMQRTGEHEMNDRRLFFATMRKPEMRVIRAALWDMKWQHNIPWETITSLEVFSTDPWVLLTDHHEIICLDAQCKQLYFYAWLLHDANNPTCGCSDCYIALAQPTNA